MTSPRLLDSSLCSAGHNSGQSFSSAANLPKIVTLLWGHKTVMPPLEGSVATHLSFAYPEAHHPSLTTLAKYPKKEAAMMDNVAILLACCSRLCG